MTISKITAPVTPIEEAEKINEIITETNLKATDEDVVHLTGNETIGGEKTFSSSPLVPTAASGDNSTKAASTAFVTSADNNLQTQINQRAADSTVVHLNGNETISGYKILTGGVTLKSVANMQEGGTYINGNPSVVQRFGTIQFLDSANGLKGYVHNYQATNGDVVSTLVTTNGTSSGGISIGSKLNGSVYTQAPASDATNSVVTTTGISKSGNGFVKLGNGIIIQWGRKPSYVSPDPQSVTFPTPFTSTNYKAVCTYFRTGGDVDSGKDHINVDTQSTTGFTFRMSDTTEYGVNWIAIGY